jgi:hypothetical protein
VATRLYLQNATAAYAPPTIRGSWTTATQTACSPLKSTKLGNSTNDTAVKPGTTSGDTTLFRRFVSDPVLRDGNLSGTMEWMAQVFEGTNSTNASFKVYAYVTSGDTDTPRGTLLSASYVTEFPTSPAAGRGEGAKAITTVACSVGDRVVFEIGWVGANTTASTSCSLNRGGTSTDLTSGDTNAQGAGWVEFSDPNTLWVAPSGLTVAEQQSIASNTAALSFTLAAGSAVGDLLVLIHANDWYAATNLTTPTGTAASTWTLQDTFDGGTNQSHIKIWTAPVTTAGAQTVLPNGTTTDEERGAGLWRIPNAVFDVANHANGAGSVSHVAPSLTPASTDEIYCCIWTNNTGSGNAVYNYTYPGGAFVGLTERDVATFATFGWGYEPITSGVATGTRTATASVSGQAWCAAAVLVKAGAAAAAAAYVPRRRGPNYRR